MVAALTYVNAVGAGYTFDDEWVIVENPIVQLGDVATIFTSTYSPGPVYRPLTLLTFAINEGLGINPMADHILNVVLHIAVTLLVLALSTRVVSSRLAQVSGALLFALHPIHTEAVTSLVGRAELLAALFALASLVSFARFAEGRSGGPLWLVLSLTAFAIGPFAKENSLTVLPMILILQWRLSPNCTWRRLGLVGAAYLIAVLPYLGFRLAFTGALTYPALFNRLDNPLAYLPAHQRVATALVVIAGYIGLLAAPISLSADYSFNQIETVVSVFDPRLWASVVLIGAIGAIAWQTRRNAPALLWCAAFAVCTMSLTSNLLFPIGTIKAERLMYLPSVGWCIGTGFLAAWAMRRWPRRAPAAFAAVLCLFLVRSWVRNADWQNNETLYRATAQTSPGSAKAQYNWGTILLDKGDVDSALLQFHLALKIDPEFRNTAFGIGKAYETKGVHAGALHWYARAAEMDWQGANAHLQTGVIRHQLGEYAAAEAAFRTGLTQEPENPFLLLYLSATRLEQGDSWEALELVRSYDRLAWKKQRYRDDFAEMRYQIGAALTL